MKFLPPTLTSLLLGGSTIMLTTPLTNASGVCSDVPLESGQEGAPYQLFPPLSIPCPGQGSRVNAEFSYRIPSSGSLQVAVAVSHEGEVAIDGLSMAVDTWADGTCADIKDNHDDFFFDGEPRRNSCGMDTEDRLVLCKSISDNDSGGSIKTVSVSAWDTGSCVGNLKIEAIVYSFVDVNEEVECVSGISHYCQEVSGGDPGSVFDFQALQNEFETSNVCTTVEESGSTNQLVPPLSIPCPAVGDRITTAFWYRAPLDGFVQATISAKHDGPQPGAGISVGRGTFHNRQCDDVKENWDDFIFKGKEDDLFKTCLRVFGDSDRICSGVSENNIPLADSSTYLSIWNDGGCQGNLTVEAHLSPRTSGLPGTMPLVTCYSGMEEVCLDAASGTGGEPFDPANVKKEDTVPSLESSLAFSIQSSFIPGLFAWCGFAVLSLIVTV